MRFTILFPIRFIANGRFARCGRANTCSAKNRSPRTPPRPSEWPCLLHFKEKVHGGIGQQKNHDSVCLDNSSIDTGIQCLSFSDVCVGKSKKRNPLRTSPDE